MHRCLRRRCEHALLPSRPAAVTPTESSPAPLPLRSCLGQLSRGEDIIVPGDAPQQQISDRAPHHVCLVPCTAPRQVGTAPSPHKQRRRPGGSEAGPARGGRRARAGRPWRVAGQSRAAYLQPVGGTVQTRRVERCQIPGSGGRHPAGPAPAAAGRPPLPPQGGHPPPRPQHPPAAAPPTVRFRILAQRCAGMPVHVWCWCCRLHCRRAAAAAAAASCH